MSPESSRRGRAPARRSLDPARPPAADRGPAGPGRSPIGDGSSDPEAVRAYYEDLLSSLEDGIVVVDRGGRIASFNQAAEELTGLSAGLTLHQSFDQAFARAPKLLDLVKKTLDTGRSHADFDLALVRANDERVAASAVVSLLHDRSGEVRGAILSLRDLSRIRELEARLHQADRMATLGAMAAGIAHEIRNPLVGLRGAAQLLEREPGFPAGLREYTRVIIREVDRLNGIVEGLLSLAGPRRPRLEPCNVNRVLEELLMLHEVKWREAGLQLNRIYDPTIPLVVGDAYQLHQLFLNLLRNAAEAMPGGGRITLRTRFERRSARCGGADAGVVEIQDQGPGLDAETAGRAFDPFFTTKPGGTGLGLPICLRIVQDHGGAIELGAGAEGGTVAAVYLPIAPPAADAAG
jgi:two-component system nitrogen regulation sensor histidine kinase GlnL